MKKKCYGPLMQLIKRLNVFKSPVTLRYDFDADYDTFAGGFLTICLFLLFFGIFFNAWIGLLNKDTISTITHTTRQFDPSLLKINTNNFMFAIGFKGLDLSNSSSMKYFDLKMNQFKIINETKTSYTVPLQPCTQEHWKSFGIQFLQTFQRQKLDKYMCPPKNLTIELNGKYTSQLFEYYKISVDKCTGTNCYNDTDIQNYVTKNTGFNFDFYYTNTLLNPEQKLPISYFFQDKDYTIFSNTLGTSTNIYIGQYQMDTDQSIAPWGEHKIQNGFNVNRAQRQSFYYGKTTTQSYAKIYLRKSNIKTSISRSYKKIDEMLSYIGGLFGLIAIIFDFIMDYYGRCSFQLQLCQHLFDYNPKNNNDNEKKDNQMQKKSNQLNINSNNSIIMGKSINQFNLNKRSNQTQKDSEEQIIQPENFGIIDFICHIVHKVISKIYKFKWKRMQIYADSLQQMRYKLDVGQIIQKLAFFDRAVSVLFSQSQLKLLYLQEKFNFQEVRQQRKLLSLRNQVVLKLFQLVSKKQFNKDNQISNILKNSARDKIKIENNFNKNSNIEQNSNVILHDDRTRKKIDRLVIGPQYSFFADILDNLHRDKSHLNNDNSDIIPPDIRQALFKLQQRIQKGDEIALRIYNGLQYDLVKAYQNSKTFTSKHHRTKKIKEQQSKQTYKQMKKQKLQPINFKYTQQRMIQPQSRIQINRKQNLQLLVGLKKSQTSILNFQTQKNNQKQEINLDHLN